MIDPIAAEHTALTLAADDANGLYDMLFAFDRAFQDDLIEERLRAAKQALRNLIARGWVRIWYASWTSPERETPIPDPDAVIDNPHWWHNHVDRMVWFDATDAGKKAFAQPEHELLAALSRRPTEM